MTSTDHYTESTDPAIDAVKAAGDALLLAVRHLDAIEAERAVGKLGAMRRLLLMENPATPGKNFTASAAADFAQFDVEYAAFTERRALAARLVMAREQELEVATLRAERANALLGKQTRAVVEA